MRIADSLIESGIIAILIYTSFFWGGVAPGALMALEWASALLLLLWLLKRMAASAFRAPTYSATVRQPVPLSAWGLYAAAGALFLWPLLQMIPLPAALIRVGSPAAYALRVESAAALNQPVADWLPLSVYACATRQQWLQFLVYPSIFFLTVQTFRTRRQVTRFVYIVLATGFIQAVSGIAGLLFDTARVESIFWISGSFVNKNHFAGYLEMVILLGFGMFLADMETRTSGSRQPIELLRDRYSKALLWLFGLLTLVGAHLLTGSRGGWLSLTAGMGCLGILMVRRRVLRRWAAVLLVVLPLAFGASVLLRPAAMLPRLKSLTEPELSWQMRRELWRTALLIFQDFPATGSGLGTLGHIHPRYRTFRSTMHFDYAHNDYVQLLAELGLPGAVAAFALAALLARRMVSAWRQQHARWSISLGAGVMCALFSLLVHSVTDFNLHIPSNALLFSVLAALGTRLWTVREAERHHGHNRRRLPGSSAASPALPARKSRFGGLAWGTTVVGISLIGWYLLQVLADFRAAWRYEQFIRESRTPPSQAALVFEEPEPAVQLLEAAMRLEPCHAQYASALGRYLHRHLPDVAHPYADAIGQQRLAKAENLLRRAVLLEPSNAAHYYELGRLSQDIAPCPAPDGDGTARHREAQWLAACPTARLFYAVLRNAPNDSFFRETVGRWLYAYLPGRTRATLREIAAREVRLTRVADSVARRAAQFFYDVQLDYESDQELARLAPPAGDEDNDVLARLPNIVREDAGWVEFGNDDGTAEWSSPLSADELRIKKIIYLPRDVEAYSKAAIRVYLNAVGRNECTARLVLDSHHIATVTGGFPLQPDWYEIPLDTRLLQGKSLITIYLRATGACGPENALQIWGDRQAPTVHSVFNLDTVDDLSIRDGAQTGEYLIRLLLRRTTVSP